MDVLLPSSSSARPVFSLSVLVVLLLFVFLSTIFSAVEIRRAFEEFVPTRRRRCSSLIRLSSFGRLMSVAGREKDSITRENKKKFKEKKRKEKKGRGKKECEHSLFAKKQQRR